MEASTCYLCLKLTTATEPHIISCFGWTSVAEILDKHFWFKLDRQRDANAVVCKPCWQKVDAFHEFYESVLASHRRRLLNYSDPTTPAAIEQPPNTDVASLLRPIKLEPQRCNEDEAASSGMDDPLEASSDDDDDDDDREGAATQSLEIPMHPRSELHPRPIAAQSNAKAMTSDGPVLAISEYGSSDSMQSGDVKPIVGAAAGHRQRARHPGYQRILKSDRELLWKLFNDGNSVTQAARIAGINASTADSIIKRIWKADGVVTESRRGGKRYSGKVNRVLDTLEKIVESQPTIAIKVVQARVKELHNVQLGLTTVHNAVKRLRITVQRTPVEAAELNAAATVEQRARYAVRFSQHQPAAQGNLIFIDISTFKYHKKQSKLRLSDCTEVSLIVAMNAHGIVLYNTMSHAVVDSGCLCAYLGELMAKLQQMGIANAWLVMDSSQIHPQAAVCWQSLHDLVAAGSHSLNFLPPHSPSLNPLEPIVMKIKAHSRDMLDRFNCNLAAIIPEAVEMIGADDCLASMRDMMARLAEIAAGNGFACD